MSRTLKELNIPSRLGSATRSSGCYAVDANLTISDIFDFCALPYEKELTCYCIAEVNQVSSSLPWYFYACPICDSKLKMETSVFTCCPACNMTVPTPEVQYRMELEAVDTTGVIRLTVFNDEARKIIDQKASKVFDEQILAMAMNVGHGTGVAVPAVVREAFEGKKYRFKIRVDEFNHDARWRQTFTVLDIIPAHSLQGNLKDDIRLARADPQSASAAMTGGSRWCGHTTNGITLPPTMVGSARSRRQNYQDAISIRFVANPKWPEVEASAQLAEVRKRHRCQKTQSRTSLLTTVFRQKLQQLLEFVKNENIFGRCVSEVYTIELKRDRLPQANILIWLDSAEVNLSPEYIDGIIQAELPDKESEGRLYEAVKQYMVHRPCANRSQDCTCATNHSCCKKFPREYSEQTLIGSTELPVYRRMRDNRQVQIGKHALDNSYVVPYNPTLLLKFDTYVNVEWCNTERAVKYLFKHILKGADKATLIVAEDREDNVPFFIGCGCVSSCRPSWGLYDCDIRTKAPDDDSE